MFALRANILHSLQFTSFQVVWLDIIYESYPYWPTFVRLVGISELK